MIQLGANTVTLITLAGLLISFIVLLSVYIKFKQIKVIKNNKNLSKEEMQVKIEQLKVVQKMASLTETKVERLIRLSGNPLNLSPSVFSAIVYLLPILLIIVGIWFALIGEKEAFFFFAGVSILIFWYFPYHYKEAVNRRRNSWFKVQQYLYKLTEELEENDYKKALLNLSIHLKSVKEEELSNGFSYMVEKWPNSPDEFQQSMAEFEYYYPFDIPKDLFSLLINAEESGLSPNNRIMAFQKTCIMKYQKFADKVLSNIPAIATCLSLPFLMISCVVALLVPNVINLLQYF